MVHLGINAERQGEIFMVRKDILYSAFFAFTLLIGLVGRCTGHLKMLFKLQSVM